MSSKIDELAFEWKSASSHRERAEVEEKLWAHRPSNLREIYGRHFRRRWLGLVTGDSIYSIVCRRALLDAGAPADPLWKAIDDGGMALGTASRLLGIARKRGGQLSWALCDVMASYSNTGYEARGTNGNLHRRRRPGTGNDQTRFVYAAIRSILEKHLRTRFSDLKEEDLSRLVIDFECEFDVLVASFQKRVGAATRHTRELAAPRREHVTDACLTLSMDPPKPGQPADLRFARRQQRKLGRLYHPDSHAGSEDTVGQYNAVNCAYRTLEHYNETLEPSRHQTQENHVEE